MDSIHPNLTWAAVQPPSQLFPTQGPFAMSLAIGLVALLTFSAIWSRSNKIKLPFVGKELGSAHRRREAYIKDSGSLYQTGYKLFKNAAYRMTTTEGDRIIVPMSELDELRKLPDDMLGMQEALSKRLESKITMPHGFSAEFLSHVVRADLTKNLNRLNPRLSRECEQAVTEELGPCEDWTSLIAYQRLAKIVAIASGCVFLGPDLCRREEYLGPSIGFTIRMFEGTRRLKYWSDWMRPFVAPFMSEIRILRETRSRTESFLLPIIKERRKLKEAGNELPDDMLQWMMNKADDWKASDKMLAESQLQLSMAAIHTTTASVINILYDIAIRPDVMEDMRAEMSRVLQEHDGVCSTQALFQMKLLDSVMRESQRVNKMLHFRFDRLVKKPITLSSGTTVPVGTTIEAPYSCITDDPALYPNPGEFDAYRFSKLRSGEVSDPINYKSTEQYQFVNVTKENMGFGFGRHACPGRFFASNELKLILIHLLLNYDIRMPDGKTERYKSFRVHATISVNPGVPLEFKRRG